MANEIRDRERGLLDRTTYDAAKSRLFGLIGLSGVEFHETSYDQDFTLSRVGPTSCGPYDALLDKVRVSYDEDHTTGYESLLLRIAHKGIRENIATLFCGTKIGITVIGGVVRYAWIDDQIPFCSSSIPEAQQIRVMTCDERLDFVEWEHEFDLRHRLSEETLRLVMDEVIKIAESE
jgi:hypothetical protein